MITVKFFGGAKKSFLHDKLEIEIDSITISDLLDHLQNITPQNLTQLDVTNILVAVNGADSSAIQGKNTILKDGDVVSIIPVVHGGSAQRTQFVVMNDYVELIRLKRTVSDPIKFVESLRQNYPDLIIQGIQARYILNSIHAKKIVTISIYAKKSNNLLSNRIETDILLRFACTRQIGAAIARVGMNGINDSMVIIIGKKSSIDRLFNETKHNLQKNAFSQNYTAFIKREFAITKKTLDCIVSDTPLEDLLVERSATLFH